MCAQHPTHLLVHLLLLVVCSPPLLPQHFNLLLQRRSRLAVGCLQLRRHLSLSRGGGTGAGSSERRGCPCLGSAQLQLRGFQLRSQAAHLGLQAGEQHEHI
jgi:hypothetical protein